MWTRRRTTAAAAFGGKADIGIVSPHERFAVARGWAIARLASACPAGISPGAINKRSRGSDPRLLRLTTDRLLDRTLGSDPSIKKVFCPVARRGRFYVRCAQVASRARLCVPIGLPRVRLVEQSARFVRRREYICRLGTYPTGYRSDWIRWSLWPDPLRP
jgi:hypothetical protein